MRFRLMRKIKRIMPRLRTIPGQADLRKAQREAKAHENRQKLTAIGEKQIELLDKISHLSFLASTFLLPQNLDDVLSTNVSRQLENKKALIDDSMTAVDQELEKLSENKGEEGDESYQMWWTLVNDLRRLRGMVQDVEEKLKDLKMIRRKAAVIGMAGDIRNKAGGNAN
jgi:hypothetical protein